MRVRARELGYFGGQLRQPGAVFDTPRPPASWMEPLEPAKPARDDRFNGAAPAKFDHDGDGAPGGSLPKAPDPVDESGHGAGFGVGEETEDERDAAILRAAIARGPSPDATSLEAVAEELAPPPAKAPPKRRGPPPRRKG